MTQGPIRRRMFEDLVVRVLGGYFAAVAAAAAAFVLLDGASRMLAPPAPVPTETAFPSDWITVAITLGMALFLVGLFALPAFLLCLTVSVRAGIGHPAFHVICGSAIGLGLWRLFIDIVDRPLASILSGAAGGAVYWWLAARHGTGHP